ncbi:MAG: adenylate/guanylate cyclase domain-containing protein [Alphaproteobacteria bacterium]|nr:adenylate/guanylate cyclase domain-containing protein [Alphaproteobacteria bacterium]
MQAVQDALVKEELDGMRLALWARFIAIAIVIVFTGVSAPETTFKNSLLYGSLFTISGLLQWWVIRSGTSRVWWRFVFMAVDAMLLVFAILGPNPFGNESWPIMMNFRYGNFIYVFIFFAMIAFSYSPLLVLLGGAAATIAWAVGTILIMTMPETRLWNEVLTTATVAERIEYYLHPNFIPIGQRVREIVVMCIVVCLMAAIVWRGRRVVRRQLMAERERQLVRNVLGKYVPEDVAKEILTDRGRLAPSRHTATILYVDLEGFTALTERLRAETMVLMLNEYFATVERIIASRRGVIHQFQGDAVLATFNVPITDESHAENGLRAALNILETVREQAFAGVRLNVRIGVSTGEVVAGSVGGEARLNYTVHGSAVNLAARLEQMNKELGTSILVADSTIAHCGNRIGAVPVGDLDIRGVDARQPVFKLA